MKLENLKGTKDFLPKNMLLKKDILSLLEKTFQSFGFEPVQTPIIEYYNILSSKYAGGAEILKETYRLKDQGKRDLCLRYDLTVPMARLIGMNPNLKFPFKRYEVGRVFRDGPIKTGRMREFTQCDVDTVGSKSLLCEAEFIEMAFKIFKELDLNFYMEVNNKKVLTGILEKSKVPKNKISESILILDKLKKIGQKNVKKELKALGITESSIKEIFSLTKEKKTPKETIDNLLTTLKEGIGREGVSELKDLFQILKKLKLDKNIVLNLTLARGLEIYTGTVFEGFLKNSEVTSSVCAGGRWDNIIGKFLESNKMYPAVGLSFGLDAIATALKKKEVETNVEVYVIPIGNTKNEAFNICSKLRDNNVNSDIDLLDRSPSKNLDYVNSKKIPFALMVGEKEIKKKKLTLKDMKSGKQESKTLNQIIKKLSF